MTLIFSFAQSAGAVEYTYYISVEEKDFSNKCPGYGIKQSNGEAPVMLELWGMQSIAITPRSTLTWSGST